MTSRGRRRSNTLPSGEHPFVCPLNSDDASLAALVDSINQKNLEKAAVEKLRHVKPPLPSCSSPRQRPQTPDSEVLDSVKLTKEEWREEFKPDFSSLDDSFTSASGYRGTSYDRPQRVDPREGNTPRSSVFSLSSFATQPFVAGSHTSQIQHRSAPPRARRIRLRTPRPTTTPNTNTMNYQNYGENSGPGASPRQAPSPQSMNHANGLNGAVGMPAMMAGLPTPAGHQSDLNYIQQMVEQLSQVLEENRAASHRITVSADRVRERAMEMDMSNDEMIKEVSAALNESSHNLEQENSRLRRELDSARFEEKANLDLCRQFQKQMAHMLEQAHAFKLKTTEDMCTWHRSYRNQLAEEREKNLQLNCQILDMQEHAARGMECLRQFRRAWEDNPFHHELQVQIVQKRQEARMWKRLALRELPDDDEEFSDDSDIIDPVEKKRLAQAEADKIRARKAEQKEAVAHAAASGSGPSSAHP